MPQPVTREGENLATEFLLISDAQTRDERAYEPEQLRWLDAFVEPTIRPPLVEVMDGVVLQAFLTGYAHQIPVDPLERERRFAIHAGDLLDVSLVTELVEAYETLARANAHLSVYAVVGNHDGLTWGNLADSQTTTWELGVNRKEFVLGAILYSPDSRGFGFSSNEIVTLLNRQGVAAVAAFPETAEALERIQRYKAAFKARDASALLPIDVKGLISVSRVEDRRNQLGYYAFERGGIKFIVLDDADKDSVMAHVDDVQLGWLFLQLRDAWRDGCRPVVLVGHHGPSDFGIFEMGPIRRALRAFPNIVAYLHGHGHEVRADWIEETAVIETPSIIDYPEAGSLVRIFRSDAGRSLRIAISLVRPDVLDRGLDAMSLQSLLEETWIMSYYDQRKNFFKRRYGPYRAVSWAQDEPVLRLGTREEMREVEGALQITWKAACGEQEPAAASVFRSSGESDEARATRAALGLATW